MDLKNNWQYKSGLEYEYSTDSGEQDEDGFFRNSQILDFQITKAEPVLLSEDLIDDYWTKQKRKLAGAKAKSTKKAKTGTTCPPPKASDFLPDAMQRYGLDRIINSLGITPDVFTAIITDGYYGQELSGIEMDRQLFKKLTSRISEYMGEDNLSERVLKLVRWEYKELYIFPGIEEKAFSIQTKNLREIKVFSDYPYPGKVELYANRLQKSSPAFLDLPLGVLCEMPAEEGFYIVDGKARYNAALTIGLTEAPFLVGL